MRKILPNMLGVGSNASFHASVVHGAEAQNGALRPGDRIGLATEIVTAFVRNNSLPSGELAPLIFSVHDALSKLEKPETALVTNPPTLVPAVPINKSITTEYLICLEDGRRFKSLRRHLKLLGMTPSEYRAKWKLPAEYPMVAPNYAAVRSALAKKIGLGLKVAGKTLGRPKKAVRTPVRVASN
jgi:predicted transcriptional regulator